MQAVLEVTAGPHAGRKIVLRPGVPVRIGRTAKSDYVVAEDTFLSSAHFFVEFSSDRCMVRDLNSSNGTYLNGTRTSEGFLREGDVITAGQSSFAVRFDPFAEALPHDPAISMDDTRPMPLAALGNSTPLAMPVARRDLDLTAVQRGLLDVLRGLEHPVFAVLDGSAAASLIDSARASGVAVETLSESPRASIMPVNPDSPAGQRLAAESWGKGWGIYVTSHQTLALVRNHLRRFQTLMTQDGAEFQFRLFNPALVRGFLPTLSGSEAKTLFGPIAGILTEGPTPGDLMLFVPGGEGTLHKTIPVGTGNGA
jgi:pSer/pThr/pTyr-binding forkhead associated (FHA) protein